MGIVLLVMFNIFTLKYVVVVGSRFVFIGQSSFRSLSPALSDSSGSIALYNGHGDFNSERTILRGRTILSARRSNDNSLGASSDTDDGSGGNPTGNDNSSLITAYPYLQCVAYINKTHSQR